MKPARPPSGLVKIANSSKVSELPVRPGKLI